MLAHAFINGTHLCGVNARILHIVSCSLDWSPHGPLMFGFSTSVETTAVRAIESPRTSVVSMHVFSAWFRVHWIGLHMVHLECLMMHDHRVQCEDMK